MTNEQINAAIAEACGWTEIQESTAPNEFRRRATGTFQDKFGNKLDRKQIPDCCNDLNAMHEAEKTLTDANMFVMAHHIERLVSAHGQHYFHATARQRAEAFLRTLGKWEKEIK